MIAARQWTAVGFFGKIYLVEAVSKGNRWEIVVIAMSII
jgi:hypothetical protein